MARWVKDVSLGGLIGFLAMVIIFSVAILVQVIYVNPQGETLLGVVTVITAALTAAAMLGIYRLESRREEVAMHIKHAWPREVFGEKGTVRANVLVLNRGLRASDIELARLYVYGLADPVEGRVSPAKRNERNEELPPRADCVVQPGEIRYLELVFYDVGEKLGLQVDEGTPSELLSVGMRIQLVPVLGKPTILVDLPVTDVAGKKHFPG